MSTDLEKRTNKIVDKQTPRKQVVIEGPWSHSSDHTYNRLYQNDDSKESYNKASGNTTHPSNNSNHRYTVGVTRKYLNYENATRKAAAIPVKLVHFKNSGGSKFFQVGMHFGPVSSNYLIIGISTEKSGDYGKIPDDLQQQLLHVEIPLASELAIPDRSIQDTTGVTSVFDRHALVIVGSEPSQIAPVIVSKAPRFSEVNTWVIEVSRVDKSQTELTVFKGTVKKSEVHKSEAVLKTDAAMIKETFKWSEADKILKSPKYLIRALAIRPEYFFIQTTQTFGKGILLSKSSGEGVSRKFTPSDLVQRGLIMSQLASNDSPAHRMSSLDTSSLSTDSSLINFQVLGGNSSQKNQGPNLFPIEAENVIDNVTHGKTSSSILNVGACVDVTPWTILLLLPLFL